MRVLREFDPWRNPLCTCPRKYSLHPYTGCSHKCLYCYATSYISVRESTPKKKFIENLRRDLTEAKPGVLVELSTSSDPYPPIESKLAITRRALEALSSFEARILITTKSSLVARDYDVLSRSKAAVMITITTIDDSLARRIEPGAPPPSARIEALRRLSRNGVPVGVRIDPVIPGLNDDESMLRELVNKVVEAGARHIVTSTYKAKPDNFKRMCSEFPDLAGVWRRLYYDEGEYVYGYRYLKASLRKRILKPVLTEAGKLRVSYATCREGFRGKEYLNAGSCDGSHLIKLKNCGSR